MYALLAVACGGGGSGSEPTTDGGPVPTGDAGPDASCAADGELAIHVSGVPSGAKAKITVTGGGTSKSVEADGTITLPSGSYDVTAAPIATSDPIVRTVYRATVSMASVQVCGGRAAPPQVEVAYAPVGSSGKAWVSNANGSAYVLGYASSALGATATQPASVVAKTNGGGDVAFDDEGNLWTLGATTTDPVLLRYPAASLAASSTPTPDRKIDVANSGCVPLAAALAFDKTGNLWVTLGCEKKVARLDKSALGADGQITPTVAIGGMTAPKGIAFDADGNLWVADTTVKRYGTPRLTGSSDGAADAELTLPNADAEELAFDSNGDLWAVGGSQVNLTRVAKADLAAAGARSPTPAVQISVGVAALPHGIAFDESGGLWVATDAGKFARLAPSQLGTSTTYAAPTAPERVITSSDVGSAGSFALYPAPAGLPLFSSMP